MKVVAILLLALSGFVLSQDSHEKHDVDNLPDSLYRSQRVRVVAIQTAQERDRILGIMNPGMEPHEVLKRARSRVNGWHDPGNGFDVKGQRFHSLFVSASGKAFALGIVEHAWKITQIVRQVDEGRWTFFYKREPGVLGIEVTLVFSDEGRMAGVSERDVMIYFEPNDQRYIGPRPNAFRERR